MNMFKTLLNGGDENPRVKFLGLTASLVGVDEMDETRCGLLVDTVVKLRNLLGTGRLALSSEEKRHLMVMLNSVKVRAFMRGTRQAFTTFQTLDAVGNDVERLL
ncbi:MAG: hypothetical protein ABII71_06315 [Candidatus Micrarchaeota archaeon]